MYDYYSLYVTGLASYPGSCNVKSLEARLVTGRDRERGRARDVIRGVGHAIGRVNRPGSFGSFPWNSPYSSFSLSRRLGVTLQTAGHFLSVKIGFDSFRLINWQLLL